MTAESVFGDVIEQYNIPVHSPIVKDLDLLLRFLNERSF